MKDSYSIEKHPAWEYEFPGIRVLLLGNFPPHKKRWDYEFFYPNKQNNFWKILAAINGTPLKEMKGEAAVRERKAILKDLKVGVYNLAKVIRRKNDSARDTDIQILEYVDIFQVIRKHPKLRKIILAGFAASSSTTKTFLQLLDQHNIPHDKPSMIKAGTEFKIKIDKRIIACVILNSTSTAFPIKLEKLVEQFLPHVKSHD
jgi:G:T/U-mismatch repair DNA glycosylase